jgi:GlcNAc-P-P-Und epimerase
MAYVGNVAAFLSFTFDLGPGIRVCNYVDEPDLCTEDLVALIRRSLGRTGNHPRIPHALAMAGGHAFDVAAQISERTFPISAIRIK